jgi:hypothetical protein
MRTPPFATLPGGVAPRDLRAVGNLRGTACPLNRDRLSNGRRTSRDQDGHNRGDTPMVATSSGDLSVGDLHVEGLNRGASATVAGQPDLQGSENRSASAPYIWATAFPGRDGGVVQVGALEAFRADGRLNLIKIMGAGGQPSIYAHGARGRNFLQDRTNDDRGVLVLRVRIQRVHGSSVRFKLTGRPAAVPASGLWPRAADTRTPPGARGAGCAGANLGCTGTGLRGSARPVSTACTRAAPSPPPPDPAPGTGRRTPGSA